MDVTESKLPAMRFSIIITCHNQREYIGAAVQSAISQGSPLKEVIVVDDASNDGSLEVLGQYAATIQVIELFRNHGASEARNQGAARATGEYLVFLDGDDALLPWALEVYERIIAQRKPKVVVGRLNWFEGPIPWVADIGPRSIEFVDYEALMLKDRPIRASASAFVVDRLIFWSAGGWSPEIFQLDDVDLSAKLGFAGRAVLICSPATVLYRVHAANSIRTVTPFLRNLRILAEKERAEQYPGGPKHRHDRRAYLGGVFFFWVTRALRARLYKDALGLAASGWLLILAAVVRRFVVRIKGRRPVEVIGLACNP